MSGKFILGIATEIGLVTGLSVLNIKACFMWIFSCYQLAPQEHCILLENLPMSISSGKEIGHHNNVISKSEGNSEQIFQ